MISQVKIWSRKHVLSRWHSYDKRTANLTEINKVKPVCMWLQSTLPSFLWATVRDCNYYSEKVTWSYLFGNLSIWSDKKSDHFSRNITQPYSYASSFILLSCLQRTLSLFVKRLKGQKSINHLWFYYYPLRFSVLHNILRGSTVSVVQ
jgi:hypothetical protein